jgi:hypothetical protein
MFPRTMSYSQMSIPSSTSAPSHRRARTCRVDLDVRATVRRDVHQEKVALEVGDEGGVAREQRSSAKRVALPEWLGSSIAWNESMYGGPTECTLVCTTVPDPCWVKTCPNAPVRCWPSHPTRARRARLADAGVWRSCCCSCRWVRRSSAPSCDRRACRSRGGEVFGLRGNYSLVPCAERVRPAHAPGSIAARVDKHM